MADLIDIVDKPCGFINVYKPTGMTSHDVVAIIRRHLPRKTKVGHTGTLDPDATGILPICVGKATRLAEYFNVLPKVYLGELTLGAATDTQDVSGKIISHATPEVLAKVTLADLEAILPNYLGLIQQLPPMVSAIKINGQKLYELARAGKEIERPKRQVEIFEMKIVAADFAQASPKASLLVTCSSGTYIRTLCHDMGQDLAVGGYMSKLERQAVGQFDLTNAHDLESLKAQLLAGDYSALLPLDLAVEHLPKVVLPNQDFYDHAIHGRLCKLPEQIINLAACRVEYQKNLVGIGKVENSFLQMHKVLV